MTTVLSISPDGTIECLDTGAIPFPELGAAQRRRASHVEPVGRLKRAAFLVLRGLSWERGPVSDWTRRWSGPWQVRFAGSREVVFTAQSRAACIAWEIAEINARMLAK